MDPGGDQPLRLWPDHGQAGCGSAADQVLQGFHAQRGQGLQLSSHHSLSVHVLHERVLS